MLETFVSYRQISRLSVIYATFVLGQLHVPLVSPDLKVLSAQRVCSTSVSAYGVCVLCLSLEVLCLRCEEGILIKLTEPTFRDSCGKHLKTVYCIIGINAFVSNAL